jgi:hypothetical protein
MRKTSGKVKDRVDAEKNKEEDTRMKGETEGEMRKG